ncbi:MAG: apolipoprotein N-acyltransferase, partial [Nitrospirae bacterium]|nr:apolipoprotein N-acyltransferase [Nitrospirota bacterium]
MKKSFEIKDIFLAASSGLLIAISFPRFNLYPVAWIGIIPLLTVLKDKDKKDAFYLGWLVGATSFIVIINWVTITMYNYGKVPLPVSYTIMFLLAAYLGLYTAIFSYLFNLIKDRSPQIRLVIGPSLWVTLELIRNYLLTGFPWAQLGYSQYEFMELIQIADITGVYGISFLIVMVNIAITETAILIKKRGRKERGHYRNLIALIAIPVLILIMVYSYGYIKLSSPPFNSPLTKGGQRGVKEEMRGFLDNGNTQKMRIGLIQGNIEQGKKWDVKFKRETIDIYLTLSKKAKSEGAGLIIWPETAAPFFFEQEREYQNELTTFAKQNSVYLLIGSPAMKGRDGLLNSAYLISPKGDVLYRYDKIHLVPFGEYVPLTNILFFINKMVEGIGDFVPGEDYTIMKTDGARFGVVICYEIIFPELVREFVKRDANLMVTITNDAWFGVSSAPYQHFSMAVFRAVENRVPVIRAANTGITGIIDASGRIIKTTDIFAETYITDEIAISEVHKKTIYTKYGDIFSYLCAAAIIFFYGWT